MLESCIVIDHLQERSLELLKLVIMKKGRTSETSTLSQMADELIIANKELAYQNEEKQKRADELIIAIKEAQLVTMIW